MTSRDPYKVLQVDREADPDVITAAYRALARRLHPDRDPSGIAEVRMAELNRAYQVLRDPGRRSEHDAQAAESARQPMGPGPLPPQATAYGPLGGRVEERRRDDNSATEAQLDFGRYTGWTLRALAQHDPDYLRWLSRHSSGIRYRRAIGQLLPSESADVYAAPKSR